VVKLTFTGQPPAPAPAPPTAPRPTAGLLRPIEPEMDRRLSGPAIL